MQNENNAPPVAKNINLEAQGNQDSVKISRHLDDIIIIQKYANGLFRNVTLEFYGINTAGIKELINPEVPIVAVSGSSTDVVFLTERTG